MRTFGRVSSQRIRPDRSCLARCVSALCQQVLSNRGVSSRHGKSSSQGGAAFVHLGRGRANCEACSTSWGSLVRAQYRPPLHKALLLRGFFASHGGDRRESDAAQGKHGNASAELCGCLGETRQCERDSRTPFRARLGPDPAALRLDKAACDREAQARSSIGRAGKIAAPKAIEHAADRVRW
jgi:hypothetical protein